MKVLGFQLQTSLEAAGHLNESAYCLVNQKEEEVYCFISPQPV